MVAGMKGESEKEKGLTVVAEGVNNGGQEIKKDGESSGGPVGRHLRTKGEAYAYLSDLSHYPNLANWLAGEAREEEARRLGRNGKKKKKEFQVVGDGEGHGFLRRNEVLAVVAQVAEGVQGSNHCGEDAALKSEDARVVQQMVAEGAQGSDCLQIDNDLESAAAGVQQKKMPEGAQENHLQTDASLESEDAGVQQQKVDDTGNGVNGDTSGLKERTEPTNHGNVQDESSSIVDLSLSCAEKVKVTVEATTVEANMNAEKDDFIDFGEKWEQIENDADLERKISLLADRKDIIPEKLLGLQVEKDADLKGTVSLETQPTDRKDILPAKLITPPKYFELQYSSEQMSSSSGEDDNCHLQKEKKNKQKQNVCCICGHLGHYRTKCKKVNECIFCRKKGHLAKDCPHEEIVREQTSNFCLKCANSGHDMFSCANDYPADDLEKIQCYICKSFGHLRCKNYGNEGPKSLSCYNCGESDHQGSECKKVQESSSRLKSRNSEKKHKKLRRNHGPPAVLAHPTGRGEKRHSAQECDEKAKAVSGLTEVGVPTVAAIPNVPRLAKIPLPKNYVPRFDPPHSHRYRGGSQNYIPMFNPPHNFGYGTQNYVPRFASPQGWSQGRGSNYPLHQRPFLGAQRSTVWQSPMTTGAGNKNWSSDSSSQFSYQPSK